MQHGAISRPKPLIGVHLLLLLAEEPRHGYELAASLKSWEFEGITPSTVYRELSRLEVGGQVRSFWEASQARGPARHMYELTAAGRDDLDACADDIRCLIGHLNGLLERVVAVGGSGTSEPVTVKTRRRFWKAP